MNEEWFWPRKWHVGQNRQAEIGPRSLIMGILNVTPDSFSDGGKFDRVEMAVQHALAMIDEGADIIDIGGESTRPGAEEIDTQTEMSRVIPVIEELSQISDCLISIDTYRADTAKAAIEAGAHIVNDVWALQRDAEMAEVVASSNSGLVAMHNSRDRACEADPIRDQQVFFEKSRQSKHLHPIDKQYVVIDPGIGFGKEERENLQLLNRLDELHDEITSFPHSGLLVGTSRKRFLGSITGRDAAERDIATAATSVAARLKGACVFRVHNVAVNKDALAVADALINSRFGWDAP